MKVSPDWLSEPSLITLMTALTDAGKDAFTVGGCVRDAVVDVPCNDIDVATNATPTEVKEILQDAGFKMIPTGVEHGTWTVRLGGKRNPTYEVTTYRRDVSTDGRRATVEFADTMEQDSERRDFTMNALYMDMDGNVFDPTGTGIVELQAGIVRFVGNADERCEEDFLRVMRYYRFLGKYGTSNLVDSESHDAAEHHAGSVAANVSGERIWEETKKIMTLPDPTRVIGLMNDSDVFNKVYGIDAEIFRLPELLNTEQLHNAKPMWHRRYLKMLGKHIPFPASKAERRQLEMLAGATEDKSPVATIAHLYGKHLTFDRHLMLTNHDKFDNSECHRGMKEKFPLTAEDVMAATGLEPGRQLGDGLKEAKKVWIQSNLTADKKTLLTGVRSA